MRTKIIATIGPASRSYEVLSQLVSTGVSIFRLNFSHGNTAMFEELIGLLRQVEREHARPLTILQDLSGPKIRIGDLEQGSITISKGDRVLLGPVSYQGQTSDAQAYPFIPFDHPEVLAECEVGDRVVLSDGGLQFRIVGTASQNSFILEASNNGLITSRKGLALPGKSIKVAALTEKDRKDLVDGLALGVDAVALSYVQTPEDILDAKAIINASGRNIPVIAKLERQNAVDRLQEIIAVSDIIMVARGDLGVECPLPELPAMQKRIIRACNVAAKPVIVATQMLLSMVNSPSPTRAETTDVANAVLDGADCVMLSEETAMGSFPVETVQVMRQITQRAEEWHFETQKLLEPDDSRGSADFLAYAACLLADKNRASAIVSHSMSGASARLISSRRPQQPIYAISPSTLAQRWLNFSWGVFPVGGDPDCTSHLQRAEYFIEACGQIQEGDDVIITAGQPQVGKPPRSTNLVKVYRK
ncbi:MAG: pyruvate kinase [Pseudomonadota bacterium]